MGINIFQVDAFTDKPFGGNAAGVVPCAKGLTDEMMQVVAREMNVSETAFINKLDDDLFVVRFFTPEKEVELCGHATIGAFFILAYKRYINALDNGVKVIYQKTKAGDLPVYIYYEDGEVTRVTMEQAKPESFGRVKDMDKLLRALNLRIEDIGVRGYDVEPEILSTGLKDIIIPVKSKEILDEIRIDKELLKEVSRDNNVVGVHLFYKPEDGTSNIFTRNFAPLVGIDEETATGTSNGATIYYLKKNNILKGNKILSHQGQSLNRPSKIYCEITEDGKIQVGGQARLSVDGILMVS